MKDNKIVICGFSGIGKTSAQKHCDMEIKLRNSVNSYRGEKHEECKRIIDLESSGWSKIYKDDEHGNNVLIDKNPKFPGNYIDDLISLMESDVGDIFLLSCHQEVRDELKRRNIKYIIVLPTINQRNDYLKRWLKRGSSIDFIYSMNNRWEYMIKSCEDDNAPKIYLDKGDYLSGVLV